MRIVFETSLPIFESPVIVTEIRQQGETITIKGEETGEISKPLEEGWLTVGGFGFVTSDIKTLELHEKLYIISKIINFARGQQFQVEFLFLIYKGTFGIHWRKRAPTF